MFYAVSLAFIFLVSYYIYFLVRVYTGLANIEKSQPTHSADFKFISVIIPFRNEEDVISDNLLSLENQSLGKESFEVIYVDDSSTDKSVDILKRNIKSDNVKILRYVNTNGLRAHKKRAIDYAIGKANGEIIVTTDADCTHGKDWLKTMVDCFDEQTGFVSGPVEFIPGNKIFEKLQALEFAGLIITGAGLIGVNNPAICNAANLAFRKDLFYKVGGYSGNLNISSGDDEFLMQKIHSDTDFKVKFCLDRKAKAFTKPNENFRSFYQQRKRWASKGLFYKNKKLVFSLILIFLFYLMLFSLPFLILFYDTAFSLVFAGGIFIKLIMEYILLKKGLKILYDENLLRYFLIAEFFHVPYIVLAPLLGLSGNYKWKDREVKR